MCSVAGATSCRAPSRFGAAARVTRPQRFEATQVYAQLQPPQLNPPCRPSCCTSRHRFACWRAWALLSFLRCDRRCRPLRPDALHGAHRAGPRRADAEQTSRRSVCVSISTATDGRRPAPHDASLHRPPRRRDALAFGERLHRNPVRSLTVSQNARMSIGGSAASGDARAAPTTTTTTSDVVRATRLPGPRALRWRTLPSLR